MTELAYGRFGGGLFEQGIARQRAIEFKTSQDEAFAVAGVRTGGAQPEIPEGAL
jgi:hypothetical protein